MAEFIDVAGLDQLARGAGRAVTIAECDVALFNVDGRLFAIEGACLRCGSSLAAAVPTRLEIQCPDCGWRYDIATGTVIAVPALQLHTYEVRIDGSRVLVETTVSDPSLPAEHPRHR